MKNNRITRIVTLLLAFVLTLTLVPAAFAESFRPSENCIDLITPFEPCHLEAYKNPAGVWVIGYQHTANVVPGMKLANEAQARELLREDIVKYGTQVQNAINSGAISFEMNQNRFDALTAFTFNCGSGNLLKLVKGHTADVVADKFLAFTNGGGKRLPILAQRRQAEKALFLAN